MKAAVCFFAVAVSACGHVQPIKPSRVDIVDNEKAYKTAVRVLVDEGYDVAMKDLDAGVVQSAWMDGSAATSRALSAAHRFERRLTVRISDGSAVVRLESRMCSGHYGCDPINQMSDADALLLSRVARAIEDAQPSDDDAGGTVARGEEIEDD